MVNVNPNYAGLPGGYLFVEVARRKLVYEREHPERTLISLGIGDVTLPIAPAIVAALHRAAAEMGRRDGFHGYGPEGGYSFLRDAIAQNDYNARGLPIVPDEIFVSDGAKSDCGGIGDLFSCENTVALCDPAYPVYGEVSILAGRRGITHLSCGTENGFVPSPNGCKADLLYLCYPNNPTGAMATKGQLRPWVEWANATGAVILYDAAYEAYIADPALPHSIFELSGAETCAIELRSFSKTAGFTGLRCGYTVVPRGLVRGGFSLRDLWARRQSARFNGVSYLTQCAAAATYTLEGKAQTALQIDCYRRNAETLRVALHSLGYAVQGGIHAPYLWVKTKAGEDSWSFFDRCLQRANVVVTPGVGFGAAGEGYFRLTAFGDAEQTQIAAARLAALG